MPTHFEIAELEPSDKSSLNEAAAVAARAFQFDPFFVFLSTNPLLRSRGLALFWRSEIAALKQRGRIEVARDTTGRIAGVAAWVKPGCWPLSPRTQVIQSLGALRALWLEPRAIVPGSKYLLAIEKVHPKEPHWYLAMLVCDPSVQRSGIGTALQQRVLDRADAQGHFSYLETQNEANLPYYRRFGYEVVQRLDPVTAGPPLWTMRREPRA